MILHSVVRRRRWLQVGGRSLISSWWIRSDSVYLVVITIVFWTLSLVVSTQGWRRPSPSWLWSDAHLVCMRSKERPDICKAEFARSRIGFFVRATCRSIFFRFFDSSTWDTLSLNLMANVLWLGCRIRLDHFVLSILCNPIDMIDFKEEWSSWGNSISAVRYWHLDRNWRLGKIVVHIWSNSNRTIKRHPYYFPLRTSFCFFNPQQPPENDNSSLSATQSSPSLTIDTQILANAFPHQVTHLFTSVTWSLHSSKNNFEIMELSTYITRL